MAFCNRDPSPALRKKDKERCMELLQDVDKIHRIVLRDPALCKLAYVESPNCVWFKLINHITDELLVTKPARITPVLPAINNNKNNNEKCTEEENAAAATTATTTNNDDDENNKNITTTSLTSVNCNKNDGSSNNSKDNKKEGAKEEEKEKEICLLRQPNLAPPAFPSSFPFPSSSSSFSSSRQTNSQVEEAATATSVSNDGNATTTTTTKTAVEAEGVYVAEEKGEEEGEGVLGQKRKADELRLYDYVLAPLEENVYARARVTHLQLVQFADRPERLFAYVHFIDEGFGVWLDTRCLAKMEKSMFSHPWQAFPVTMFRVRTRQNDFFSSPDCELLPASLTATLVNIMSNYEYFKVVPVIDSRRHPDYFEYTRAEIYGLETLEDDEGPEGKSESITHRMLVEFADTELLQLMNDKNINTNALNNQDEAERDEQRTTTTTTTTTAGSNGRGDPFLIDRIFDRSIFDAKQHPLLRKDEGIPFVLTLDLLAEIPKWRLKWPKRFWRDPGTIV